MLRGLTLALSIALLAACADDELRILPIDDQTVFVDEFLRVPFTVRDPGTPDYVVAWSGPDLPYIDRWAFVVRRPDGGEFQWSPTEEHVGEHTITIKVDTGGTRASQSFDVEVLGAREAAPVFAEPGPGAAFDVTEDRCIELPVEVRDRDTAEPELSVVFGLPLGATFEDHGGGLGTFRWCPRPDQVAAAAQWVVTFAADDGEHATVLHDVRLLLVGPGKETCGGEPPEVEFVEPADGEAVVSRVGYDVRIRVRDDRPLRERPGLFYTDGRIEQRDQIEFDRLSYAPFVPDTEAPSSDDGSTAWVAHIPTFRLADDEAKTIAMVPWVSDDDDPTGTRCDNVAPTRIRRFTAIGAVEAGILNICERCLVSGDCISGTCLRTAQGGRCVPSCSADETTCGNGTCEPWNSMEGVVRFGCGPAELLCFQRGECGPDVLEPNGDVERATPIGSDATVSGSLCERDDDWFVVSTDGQRRVRVTLTPSDGAGRDFELRLAENDGRIRAVAALDGDTATAETCVDGNQDLYAHVFSPTLERGSYRLAVETIDEDCTCEDDANEPDGPGSPRRLEAAASGVVCGLDSDVFEIDGEPGSRTTIAMEVDGEGDLDIDLTGPGGERVASSRGIGDAEWFEADLPTDGPYRLQVFSYDGRDASYTLTVERTPLAVCSSASECALDEGCFGGTCRRIRCLRNADCPIGAICPLVDTVDTGRTCLETCAADEDCGADRACKDFFEGRACYEAGDGVTGDDCTSTGECAGNRACVDWPGGHCAAAGCDRGPVCGADSACAVVDGRATCVETCWVSDDECDRGNGQVCGELFSPTAELVYGCAPTTR